MDFIAVELNFYLLYLSKLLNVKDMQMEQFAIKKKILKQSNFISNWQLYCASLNQVIKIKPAWLFFNISISLFQFSAWNSFPEDKIPHENA